jgi:hypothetical protein
MRRQRGMTFLGLLILVAFVGMFVFAGIKLAPAYLEYMEVNKALESLKTDGGGTPQSFRLALEKRFDIEDIKSLDWRDVEITRDGQDWVVHAAYQYTTEFVGNVGFVVNFDKTVVISGS